MSETELSPENTSTMRRVLAYAEQHWIRCLVLFAFGVATRFPALQGQLVWDDTWLVRDNPFIKSPLLIPEAFRHFLSLDTSSSHYRPVQNISYFFDYLVWNADPSGYHLSSLFWHVGSGILLYFLLLRLLEPFHQRFLQGGRMVLSATAFVVALLWIVHPVHSAAVDYISGRADSLAFFFACGGWLLYLRARGIRSFLFRALLYTFAAFSGLLALCSRETACIWMLLFLVHLLLVNRRATSRRTKVAVLVVCLSLVGFYAGLRHLPARAPAATAMTASPSPARGVLMLRALGDYSRLMLFPTNLHVERTVQPPPVVTGHEGWQEKFAREYLSLLGIVAAAALMYGASRKGRAQPIRAFGAAWFILAYLPISNLFELNATVAEHWLYLPSVGFLLFAAGCVLELPARGRTVSTAFACLALVGFSVRSFVRSGDWSDSETFYRHALAAGATKTRMALNLAQIYAGRGDYAKAEPLLRKVVSMSPDYAMAQNALGHLLLSEGKREEAEKVFAVATQLSDKAQADQPRTWIAALNVAYMRYKEQDLEGALAVTTQALADYPETWQLISYKTELTRRLQGAQAALPLMTQFADSHWWHAGAFLALGRLWAEVGDAEKAEAALRHASWLDIHDAESLNLIAEMNIRQNRLDAAYTTQRRAVSRQPDQPRQYLILSDILTRMGRSDEARAALAQASEMKALADASVAIN